MDFQPKTTKNTQIRRIASFGAAMSALAVTPIADATVMPLAVSPSSVPANSSVATLALGTVGSLSALNSAGGKFFGAAVGIDGIRATSFSNSITEGTGGFGTFVSFSASATGPAILAFKTASGNFGWLQFTLGGPGGPIGNFAAAFENEFVIDESGNPTDVGAPIHAGPAPEPSTIAMLGLGLLAMGATGVRRLRRERQAAS